MTIPLAERGTWRRFGIAATVRRFRSFGNGPTPELPIGRGVGCVLRAMVLGWGYACVS
jgi:hypothetical protein